MPTISKTSRSVTTPKSPLAGDRNAGADSGVGRGVKIDFYSTSFCEPCMLTRSVLGQASSLVSGLDLVEHDVVKDEAAAERLGIRMTPTVIVSSADGTEVYRAEGVPSLNQVLVALAKAV